jgi:protein-tyrosine kinase
MSKIHLALEKAEKERLEELKKKVAVSLTARKEARAGQGVKPPVVRLDQVNYDASLVSLYQPHSLVSEQFRKLRTHILRLSLSRPVKTIMVTSAIQGEGKSFVSANLAIGIAFDLQLHALLVDCDLRNPTVSPMFGSGDNRGISDYLIGEEDISNFLVKTELEKLSLIPGGTIPENPVEIIGSKRMGSLVEELKARYENRFIILDSTPLLATAEPGVLAKLVDGIIIVVRAGQTPRETVQQALGSLDREKILGVVLNHVEFKSSTLFKRYFGANGYYSGYGNGYGYRKPEKEEHKVLRKLFRLKS